MSNKENFFSRDKFELPIEFLENKTKVLDNLKEDLELETTIDKKIKPIYNYVFNPKTELGELSIDAWSRYYTTDKQFLKDSQKIYNEVDTIPFDKQTINNMVKSWREIRHQNNFMEKYQYIDWEKIKFLNKSTLFLSILSFYNMSAPVLQLIAPVFILIVPFFVLKVMNLPITWKTYYKILIENIKNHAVGKLFFSFSKASLGQKLYILFAAGMYIWNIYQNILSCYRFYQNTHYITNQFEIVNNYLDYSTEKMKYFLRITRKYKSYDKFNHKLKAYIERLQLFHNSIRDLPKNSQQIGKIAYIGKLMRNFYVLYDDQELEHIIEFSFGFHGYIDSIMGINENLKSKKMNTCKFTNKLTFKLKNMYHPTIDKPIKNSLNMTKSAIITGPNAAGKTTTIKATIINLLLTQQLGLGFFEKCNTSTFEYIHCYLNIPDSCSRDSLFQAEARRCKDILDCIVKYPKKTHFCIFDELYSGTNPYEAISSAYSYLNYISKNKNVRFLLTTHFIRLCKLFENKAKIINKSMKTEVDNNNNPIYTYKITNGISTVKGGVSVLRNLEYPENIIKMSTRILEKI
tara:strand:+ start:15387 stop:17108 length:1722 start_codon:yes stop_codon:yes gene_type:complete